MRCYKFTFIILLNVVLSDSVTLLPGTLHKMARASQDKDQPHHKWTYFLQVILHPVQIVQADISLIGMFRLGFHKVNDIYRKCKGLNPIQSFEHDMVLVLQEKCGSVSVRTSNEFLRQRYKIYVHLGFMINVTMLHFSIPLSANCKYNHMKVLTGRSGKAYCGKRPPWSEYSENNTLVVDFNLTMSKFNTFVLVTYDILDLSQVKVYAGVQDKIFEGQKKLILDQHTAVSLVYQNKHIYAFDVIFPKRSLNTVIEVHCNGGLGSIYIFEGPSELAQHIFEHHYYSHCNTTLYRLHITWNVRIIIVGPSSSVIPYDIRINSKVSYSRRSRTEISHHRNRTLNAAWMIRNGVMWWRLASLSYEGFTSPDCRFGGVRIALSYKEAFAYFCENGGVPLIENKVRLYGSRTQMIVCNSIPNLSILSVKLQYARAREVKRSGSCMIKAYHIDTMIFHHNVLPALVLLYSESCTFTIFFPALITRHVEIQIFSSIINHFNSEIRNSCHSSLTIMGSRGDILLSIAKGNVERQFNTSDTKLEIEWKSGICLRVLETLFQIKVKAATYRSTRKLDGATVETLHFVSPNVIDRHFILPRGMSQVIEIRNLKAFHHARFHIAIARGYNGLDFSTPDSSCMKQYKIDVTDYLLSRSIFQGLTERSVTAVKSTIVPLRTSNLTLVTVGSLLTLDVTKRTESDSVVDDCALFIHLSNRPADREAGIEIQEYQKNVSWQDAYEECEGKNSMLYQPKQYFDTKQYATLDPVHFGTFIGIYHHPSHGLQVRLLIS